MEEEIITLADSKISWDLQFLRFKYRIANIWARFTGNKKNVYVWERVSFYKEMWKEASSQLSAQFLELGEGIWEIRYRTRVTRINIHMVELDDPVILSLAGNKPLCYALMKEKKLPIPEHVVFKLNELDKAKRFMEENEGLFVIKPAIDTSAGMGVTTHIKSYRECRIAAALASLYNDQIIIERFIPGEAYRILLLGGKLIHASRRRGLRVKGDGKSTIKELIEGQNKRSLGQEHNDKVKQIKLDREYKSTLEAQGLSSNSVIGEGSEILVKGFDKSLDTNAEVRTVYNESVTDLICKRISEQAIRAARIINSQFAGVDIITLDSTVPLEDSGGIINEINTTPGLQHHYNLFNNEDTISPAVTVLSYLLESSSK